MSAAVGLDAAPRDRVSGNTVFDVLEAASAFLVLLLMGGTVVPHLLAGASLEEGAEAPAILQLMWPPVYLLILAAAATRLNRFGSVWVGVLLTLPLLIVVMASVGWSLDPAATARRGLALMFTCLFGFYLAARYSWRGILELAAGALVVMAAGSLVVSLAAPSVGVHAGLHDGAWKGLFLQKNAMGGSMALGVLACLCAGVLAPQRRLLWWLGAGLCAVLVIGSTSTTALLGFAAVLCAMMALAFVRTGGLGGVVMLWCLLLAVLGVTAMLALAPDLFFEAVGKDATLTGRTDIWDALLLQSAERPLLGYGYAAFWGPDHGPAARIQSALEWEVPSAHNGWLEILIQLGWVGLGLFVLHFVLNTVAAVSRLWSGPEAYWAVLSTFLVLFASVSESALLSQHSLSTVLYIATFAKLFQSLAEPPPLHAATPPHLWEETRLA